MGVSVLQVERLPEGTQFRLARIAAGLTLLDVSSRADVSPPRLSEFERGLASALSPEAVERVRSVITGTPQARPASELASAVA
jgi:transcriptional regulator with XRE-family HTH domain